LQGNNIRCWAFVASEVPDTTAVHLLGALWLLQPASQPHQHKPATAIRPNLGQAQPAQDELIEVTYGKLLNYAHTYMFL
jgi:hypothetical protein